MSSEMKDADIEMLFGEDQDNVNLEEMLRFPDEVEDALEKLFPDMDPLSARNFNETDFINREFPTEQSLSNIDEVMNRMKLEIRNLDKQIREVVHGEAGVGYEGEVALGEAKDAINQLFSRIKDIKEKAETSEHMVKAITRDIKQLDIAKTNLTFSITTLENLSMLVCSIEDLSQSIAQRKYSEVEKILERIGCVSDTFQLFKDIKEITELLDSVTQIQTDLGLQIKKDFDEGTTTKGIKESYVPLLSDACRVVNLLDPILRYCCI